MNILILGGGGREHALAWRLSLDKSSDTIHVWPGNDGMTGKKIKLVKSTFNQISFSIFIKENNVSLVIPGSEKYLYDGVADWCKELNVSCFGPSKNAARLEKSKLFSKTLMLKANVPTSPFRDLTAAFSHDLKDAQKIIEDFKHPVIKISGPSLGKGVFVCKDSKEATEVLIQLKENPLPGMEDGLMVEEGVSGKEVSVFFACQGTNFSYLGSAQDHKRLLDADQGPNTGGMGAVSPVAWADENFIQMVTEKFLQPTLLKMKHSGNEFSGVLFLGLMVDGNNVNLLEYNVRFGDPETQVILPLVEGDFTAFLINPKNAKLTISKKCAIHVVKAARGYPGIFGTKVEKGSLIKLNLAEGPDAKLFFAGVTQKNNNLVTDGGRVLGVTTWGNSKEEARENVYKKLNHVTFEGEQYRKDIGLNL
jgi:phosphoribosylamine--glycine ligase